MPVIAVNTGWANGDITPRTANVVTAPMMPSSAAPRP